MTLLWPSDEQGIDLSQGRVHAFIVGVGEYPHMSGGGGDPAVENFGLQQLTTTPITTKAVSKWLMKNRSRLATPLGSIEVLMSPDGQIIDDQGTRQTIEPATMQNIEDSFDQWWTRCNAKEDNVALFYFAGHGLSVVSHFLLPSDFGSPNSPKLWKNCIDFTEMRIGMRANAANTQLFFIDACKETPIDALVHNNPSGESFCSSTILDHVDSSAAYFAAAEGMLAYGPDDDSTYFSQALLESLEGAGANNQGGKWTVDTFSLGNSIAKIIEFIAKTTGHPLTSNPDVDGIPKPICLPPHGMVKTSISCSSQQANDESSIKLQRNQTSHSSARGEPRPWVKHVEAGEWSIDIKFQTLPSILEKDTLMPPVYDRVEPV